jgi:peptidoglycan/LPS O-acetylase OafA/YrhL
MNIGSGSKPKNVVMKKTNAPKKKFGGISARKLVYRLTLAVRLFFCLSAFGILPHLLKN